MGNLVAAEETSLILLMHDREAVSPAYRQKPELEVI